jgi:site-specific recombinase XerD
MDSRRLALAETTPVVVHRYMVWWKSRWVDPHHQVYGLRRLFAWLVQEGMIAQNPTQDLSCAWIGVPGGFHSYHGSLRGLFARPGILLKYHRLMFWRDLERYVEQRRQHRYSRSYFQHLLQQSFDFHQYVARHGVRRLADIRPEHLDAYGRYRLRKWDLNAVHVRLSQGYIEHFLRFAFRRRGLHFRPPPLMSYSMALPRRLLEDYLHFCRLHTGHKATTAHNHRKELLRLGQFLDTRGRRKIQQVTLQDLEAYCVLRSKTHHVAMKPLSILRSFLRYLYLQSILSTNLARHLQSPCRFQANTRPKYLSWPTVQRLLDAISRQSVSGKRDYAILSLLACHGLRAREAAALYLADIDWKNNSFLLRERKNGDTTPMPLAPRAREALRDYLAVRPSSSAPQVFLTIHAPIKPLGRSLTSVVQRQVSKHLGRLLPKQGAYVLRHSFAKALLDGGATLPEIGTLLGHKSLQGTGAYMRIATEDMREVADNYAALLLENNTPSCATS